MSDEPSRRPPSVKRYHGDTPPNPTNMAVFVVLNALALLGLLVMGLSGEFKRESRPACQCCKP